MNTPKDIKGGEKQVEKETEAHKHLGVKQEKEDLQGD